jgi:hypothetical protein
MTHKIFYLRFPIIFEVTENHPNPSSSNIHYSRQYKHYSLSTPKDMKEGPELLIFLTLSALLLFD